MTPEIREVPLDRSGLDFPLDRSGLETPASLPAELRPFTFLVGGWEDGALSERWVARGDLLYGVAFTPTKGTAKGETAFEVSKIRVIDGLVQFVAMPSGGAPVAFPVDRRDEGEAVFVNVEHDFPQRIRYTRTGSDANRLEAAIGPIDGPESVVFRYTVQREPRAEVLERADTAFAREVAERGVDAWLAAFDPAGTQWNARDGVPVHVGDEMRAYMADTLAGTLSWTPFASGFAKGKHYGYTFGDWTWTPPDGDTVAGRGIYVTIWRRQADGTYRVWFDTGDAIARAD